MAKIKLTDAYIRTRPRPDKGNVIDYDTQDKGFACRFTTTGVPTFLYCYGSALGGGSARRMVVGPWSDASGKGASSVIPKMRKRAGELAMMVAAGRDPYAEQVAKNEQDAADRIAERRAREAAEAARKEAYEAEEARLTVAQLCARYTDPEVGHKLGPDTIRRVQRRIDRYLIPAWGELKADTIDKKDVLALLHPVRRAGKRAEVVHVLSLVSGLYGWAIAEDVLPLDRNPAKGIKRMLDHANELPSDRERALHTAGEFRAFWHVTDLLADVSPGKKMQRDIAECLRFMLFTGARPSEAAGLRWDELDMEKAIWNKPTKGTGRAKSKRADALPLVGQAMAILRPRQGNESEYVFPSGRSRRVVNGGGEGFLTANRLATGLRRVNPYFASKAVEPFVPHDVRRTLATGMNEIGVSSDLVERTLNHAMPKLKKTYDKSRQTRIRRRAMEAWVKYFAEVVRTGKTIDDWEDEQLPETDNVVPIRRAEG